MAFLTIDVTYLLADARFEADDPGPGLRRWYVLGLGVPLHTAWAAVMAVGVWVGSALPEGLRLDRAATFLMIGLIVTSVPQRLQRIGALLGGAAGLLTLVVPVTLVPVAAAAAAFVVAARPPTEPDRRSPR